jgi:hypothetical protein
MNSKVFIVLRAVTIVFVLLGNARAILAKLPETMVAPA